MDPWWPAYLAIGVLVGLLAGLLGIGGGMVMVPMLVFVFRAKGFAAEQLLHIAIATGMASIVFTSISSVRAHHAHGAVDWKIAIAMSPGMVAGSFGAALAAGFIPTRPLAVLFAGFIFYAATRMMFGAPPRAERPLPGPAGLFAAGAGIGAASSLLAAGGAFLSIPFLARRGVPLKRALGTAAANGFPVAVAGSAGYALHGLRVADLPAGSLGYIYLPALVPVVVTSMLAAPLGARLAHRLPVARLRTLFALLFYLLAARMLASLW